MSSSLLLFLILGLMGVGYYSGRRRSLALANIGGTRLHSLPAYYGFYAALWAGLPAVTLLALWLFFQDSIITRLVIAQLPAELNQLSPDQLNLLLNDIRNIATGNIVSGEITAAMQAAADHYIHLQKMARNILWAVALLIVVLGLFFANNRISAPLRARNAVEKTVLITMMMFSTIAILTTLGVVFSVVYESMLFFREVPVTEFLFGTEWSPQIALREDQSTLR